MLFSPIQEILHNVATRTPTLPCSDVIQWRIQQTKADTRTIHDDVGNCIGSFQSIELERYYKFYQPEILLTREFVEQFHVRNDTKVLASWWIEQKRFTTTQPRNDRIYPTTHLRIPYLYAMAVMCRLYGQLSHLTQGHGTQM